VAKQFKWNPECLVPSSIDIDFGPADPGGPFILRELSRTDLLTFINECIEKKFIKEDGEREAFGVVVKEQEEVINKYFALATSYGDEKNKRTPEFFATLEIPTMAYGDLIEAFFNVNHLDEILATGGNWLMLPTVREIQKQTEASEKE
jgi:hypothetical protein